MLVDVFATCVRIHSPDEVFASCAEFAGLSLDLLRPLSMSPVRFLLLVLSSLGCHWIYCVLRLCPATHSCAMSDMDSQEQDS